MQLSYKPVIASLDIYPREIELFSHKILYTNVCSSFICHIQELEATQVPVNVLAVK